MVKIEAKDANTCNIDHIDIWVTALYPKLIIFYLFY